MGDRVSIQFKNKDMEWGGESVVLFHHWGGEKFADFAKGWAIDFKMKILKLHEGKGSDPLSRLEPQNVMIQFIKALSDDLNTPRAISILHELSSEQKEKPSQKNRDNLIAAGNLLGFFNLTPQEWFDSNEKNSNSEIDISLVERKVLERDKARDAGDFSRADKLRNELTELGIVLEDGPKGTKWRHN